MSTYGPYIEQERSIETTVLLYSDHYGYVALLSGPPLKDAIAIPLFHCAILDHFFQLEVLIKCN